MMKNIRQSWWCLLTTAFDNNTSNAQFPSPIENSSKENDHPNNTDIQRNNNRRESEWMKMKISTARMIYSIMHIFCFPTVVASSTERQRIKKRREQIRKPRDPFSWETNLILWLWKKNTPVTSARYGNDTKTE